MFGRINYPINETVYLQVADAIQWSHHHNQQVIACMCSKVGILEMLRLIVALLQTKFITLKIQLFKTIRA